MRVPIATLALFGIAAEAIPTWGSKGPNDSGHPGECQRIGNVQVGPRPYYLVDNMSEGPLKQKLESCANGPFRTTRFSISHRGAPLEFPEHSRQGYQAAGRMGAGIIECDVSFTSDRELVCRHSNCDLHYTTDILRHPELAAKCTEPFVPYNATTGKAASAKCCTSDITLKEFKSLCAEMEATTMNALNATQFMGRIGSTPDWRTNLYAYGCAELMSLKEQIALVDRMGLDFTAEAKTPEIPMPFQGNYTQEMFADQIVQTFKQARIPASRVWLQSFLPDDIFFWLKKYPDFGRQAIYLDQRADLTDHGYDEAVASLPGLKQRGVQIIAPSIWQLVTVDNSTQTITASRYAKAAKAAGLEIITWSWERAGPLYIPGLGGYYFQSVKDLIKKDGDEFNVIDVVVRQVGVTKMFSDWPATLSYYGSCFGLE